MFENCFSLGAHCETASSLSRLGLRNIAVGLFDWVGTPRYQALLAQIESGFADFMNKENLFCDQNRPGIFYDRKYSFSFTHDITNSYEDEIDSVIKRYQRRTRCFLQLIRQPTVFFRCLSEDDVDYINTNWKYAEEVVKHYNDKNEIVYILYPHMEPLTENVRSFRLPVNVNADMDYLEMRYLFDQSRELLEFCSHLIDEEQRRRNLIFNTAAFEKYEKVRIFIRILSKCVNRILKDYGTGAYIWGTGQYTEEIQKYLENKNKKLFSDFNTDRDRDKEFILIDKLSDMDKEKAVIVPLFSAKEINAIKGHLRSAQKNNPILSFLDMYPAGMPPVRELFEWKP